MDHLFKRGAKRAHPRFAVRDGAVGRCVGLQALHGGDPTVEHQHQRAAFWTSFGRKVADELAIRGETLSLASLQAALRRQVGICYHKVFAHSVCADGLQQEAFAGTVAPDEESKRCAAVCDKVQIGQQRAYLRLAAHRDVGQADARYHAAFERVEDDGGDALGDARRAGEVDGPGGIHRCAGRRRTARRRAVRYGVLCHGAIH